MTQRPSAITLTKGERKRGKQARTQHAVKFVWFVCRFWHPLYLLILFKFYRHGLDSNSLPPNHLQLFPLFLLSIFTFDCCLFCFSWWEHPKSQDEKRSARKWDANQVTQPRERLKMKRERRQRGDEAVAAREIFGDDDSHPAWRESVFKIRRLGRRAAGSGSQMDYSGSNHHTKNGRLSSAADAATPSFRFFVFFFGHDSCLSISVRPSTVWVRSEPRSQAISSTAAQGPDADTHKHSHAQPS